MTPAEIEKLSGELKEEKARYSVLASEYNLVLEELKELKTTPAIQQANQQIQSLKNQRVSLTKEMDSLIEQIDNLKDARTVDLEDRNYAEAEMKYEIETLKERVSNLNDSVFHQAQQNREIKKQILKRHIPEEFHNLLEQLVGDSSYE
mgnify:CR=1 FL=1|tara:strand:- start:49 stop:492 length:444 start_codon:yes stop_codon:yes gene_type:complete